ncbi:AmmeMemoRadiSam system protein B, partial [Desulfovulcanus sp.]
MDRQPIVAGQFYPGTASSLRQQVHELLQGQPHDGKTILAMVPHAGYIFSGSVAGKTLSQANLGQTVVMLGVNHTGYGARIALWPEGKWLIPGGYLQVNESLAQEIEKIPGVNSDYQAHLYEHSLEVILPFLWAKNNNIQIVPLSVSEFNMEILLQVGQELAQVISRQKDGASHISLVVSSDMTHYLAHKLAKKKDQKAIEQILNLDPRGLFTTVQQENISMCGVL